MTSAAGATLVLASRSPQRRAILESLGIPFRVAVSAFAERERGRGGAELAAANARGKALSVAAGLAADAAVLGADTVVAIDGHSLGTPADDADAGRMLRALAGREHQVTTALCLVAGGVTRQASATTAVRMRAPSAALLDWYVARGEWRGRAGGYAIQLAGAALVESIAGDWSNAVGLPVPALCGLLEAAGLAPWTAGPRPALAPACASGGPGT